MLGFHFSPFGRALDHAFFDAQSRQPFHAAPLPPKSAIVLIDEPTMSAIGKELPPMRWPFPRWVFAGLIAALDRAGAEKIVFDFTFFEPESVDQDQLLASIAAGQPATILGRTKEKAPVFWDAAFIAAHPDWFKVPRMGDTTFNTDADGVARRYYGEDSLAAVASGIKNPTRGGLLRWHGNVDQLNKMGYDKVAVLSATRFMVRGVEIMHRLTEAVPDLTPEALVAALAKEPALTGDTFDQVRGRTVFVGSSSSGTFDVKALPVGQVEPGVLLQWTAWTNFVANSFITPIARSWSLVVAGLVGLVIFGASAARPGLTLAGFATGALVAVMLAGAYVIASYGWFFAPSTPVVAATLTLLGVAAESFWREQQRKREIQAMFGSYVAPSVVDQLVRDPNAIRLGGERKEATVFFCDLAGFTDLSEKIPPELLLTIINRYLEEISDSLMEHGAYIDKYIGDAVMAVFGVPQPLPDHAVAACRGALAAQRVFRQFSDDIAREHGHRPQMRIGINTGEMIVGNLGSERKKNYTVLGDPVNLASRLEGANKEFGTSIMLGESTARLVQSHFVTRPLTRLRVKGKTEAIEVHELIGEAMDLDPARQAFVTAYCEGYRLFADRQFAAAGECFARANAALPGDRVTLALMADATKYAAHPPAPDWQPILKLDSK